MTDSFLPIDFMQGYSKKPVHPMYKTTTQDYGQQKPDVHSMPNVFHCKSQKFSNVSGENSELLAIGKIPIR